MLDAPAFMLALARLGIGLLAIALDQSLSVGFYEGAVFGAAAEPIEFAREEPERSDIAAVSARVK